jgi:ELWxxDGT repeat protein
MRSRTPARRLRAVALPLLLLSLRVLSPGDAAAFGVPALLKDINPGAGASSPQSFFVLGNKLVFFANDGTTGTEPWVTDGSAPGTFLLRDVWPGPNGGFNPGCAECNAVAAGGLVYFSASDGTGGSQLWRTDGTTAGTVKLYAAGTASGLSAVGNTAFFFSGTNSSLYRSDGTAGGTVRVTDNTYLAGYGITGAGGTVYFPATDGFSGVELWKSSGNPGPAVRVKDLYPGSNDANLAYLTDVNGTLFFRGNNGVSIGLFKSDGTDPGTVLVKALGMQGGLTVDPRQIINVNGTIYLIASDPAHGFELWKSDGTTLGTVMVKDIYPGSYGGLTGGALVAIGTTVYFVAADDTHGFELWKSDGTDLGTVMVKDVFPGIDGSLTASLANVNGTLFFRAQSSYAAGVQPWTSDGTEPGTQQLASLYPANTSQASSFTAVNGTVFFAASDGTHGVELWSVAGAAAGVTPAGPDDGSLALMQNHPNPVRTTSSIAYTLAVGQQVALRLYDTQGRVVRTLVDAEQAAGMHRVVLDARGLANGVYYYRLTTGSQVRERKLVLQH